MRHGDPLPSDNAQTPCIKEMSHNEICQALKICFKDLRANFSHASAEREKVAATFRRKQCIPGMRFRGAEKEDPLFFEKNVSWCGKGFAANRRH